MRHRFVLVLLLVSAAVPWAAAQVPAGAEFRVNTYTTYSQMWPVVSSDPAGNFVVVWRSLGQDGSSYGVFGQRYDASGTPQGAEFQVNTFTPSAQGPASVASDARGNFVVVWTSHGRAVAFVTAVTVLEVSA